MADKIAEIADDIKNAAYNVGLVVVRNVAMFSREEFRDLGTEFGELENIGQLNERVDAAEDDPAWYLEEMRRRAGSTGERPGIQRGVHQDRAYVDPPSDISILRTLESSTVGGNTNFVDMRAVFTMLMEPGEMNDRIVEATGGAESLETLEVGHSYSDVSLKNGVQEIRAKLYCPSYLDTPLLAEKRYSTARQMRSEYTVLEGAWGMNWRHALPVCVMANSA